MKAAKASGMLHNVQLQYLKRGLKKGFCRESLWSLVQSKRAFKDREGESERVGCKEAANVFFAEDIWLEACLTACFCFGLREIVHTKETVVQRIFG